MIRINLLPFRAARKKENLQQQLLIFVVLLALLVAGCFYAHFFYFKSKIAYLTETIEQKKKELEEKNRVAAEVEKLRKRLAELERKTEVVKRLEWNRKDTFRILDTLTDVVVTNRMWFKGIKTKERVTGKDDNKTIILEVDIDGIAMDQPTVAVFMGALKESKVFSNVNLKSITVEEVKPELFLKLFRITCNMVPQKMPQEKKTEDEKNAKNKKKRKK